MSIDWNGQLVDQLDWHWQHVLHISREAIYHRAEICLLRDLYRNRG